MYTLENLKTNSIMTHEIKDTILYLLNNGECVIINKENNNEMFRIKDNTYEFSTNGGETWEVSTKYEVCSCCNGVGKVISKGE